MEVHCSCGRSYEFDHEVSGHTFTCQCGRRLTAGSAASTQPAVPVGSDLLERVADETRRRGRRVSSGVVFAVVLIVSTVILLVGRLAVREDSGGPSLRQPIQQAKGRSASKAGDVASPRPRLETGAILTGAVQPEAGGVLRVINFTAADAFVKLAREPEFGSGLLFFVGSGDTAAVEGIPDGVYSLRFATGGAVWDPVGQTVIGGTRFRFDSFFEFETVATGERVSYTEHQVTLHPVKYGNAPTRRISAADF